MNKAWSEYIVWIFSIRKSVLYDFQFTFPLQWSLNSLMQNRTYFWKFKSFLTLSMHDSTFLKTQGKDSRKMPLLCFCMKLICFQGNYGSLKILVNEHTQSQKCEGKFSQESEIMAKSIFGIHFSFFHIWINLL